MNSRLATALLALGLFACASASDKTKPVRTALDAGKDAQALAALNEDLDVKTAKELPKDTGGDNALLLLDRAMVLQALQQYDLSSRDLQTSDKQIEVLDLSRNAMDEIGRYLFSDSSGRYKAPAYEKLMINTMNMVNYLTRGDLNGARIEARRLAVMQQFIERSEGKGRGLLSLGSYLAGFTFEKSGNADEALRYYDEALQYGKYRSLEDPIRRLAERSAYRTDRIRAVLAGAPAAEAGPAPATPPSAADAQVQVATPDDSAELLVIVGYGRVPPKIAKRIPIGLALTYASVFMSPANYQQANRLAAQGLVTWINYPELAKPRANLVDPTLNIDRAPRPLDGVLAVDLEAQRAWEDAKGAVIASAITRMVTRIVAGTAAGYAAGKASGNDLVGALVSLGTQATLTAVDTPDTRSWETLPARVAIGRLRLPPGKHQIVVNANGRQLSQVVNLTPNGFATATLTVLR
ncbi:MAG TPA: hypothetical protein VGQ57_04770 [Polyangiaceae bacterium]|nr:hypothetical protein [Polyangiaceae bacterium]